MTNDYLTAALPDKKCTIVRWGLGTTLTLCGIFVVLIGFAIAGSNKAYENATTSATAAANVDRRLDTHEQVQKVQMDQIKSDLGEIKADSKDIKQKLK